MWVVVGTKTTTFLKPLSLAGKFTSSSRQSARSQLLGRRRGERVDSVTPEILKQRKEHLDRIHASLISNDTISQNHDRSEDEEILKLKFKKMGLGRKKLGSDQRRLQYCEIGAQGSATFLGSCVKPPWPRFKHMLPEIALAGHSNSGKSTLLNSLVGMTATRGPARVSDRAGWTDALFWYQVGAKPPKLSLVDLPGYGHAVASSRQLATWDSSTKAYLETRRVLTLCCVLVDSTRGLCKEDEDLISFLLSCNVPHQIILTKGDLLSTTELARCVTLVSEDLSVLRQEMIVKLNTNRSKRKRRSKLITPATSKEGHTTNKSEEGPIQNEKDMEFSPTPPIAVVSGHTGAGVHALYKAIVNTAERVSAREGVPIHINAMR